MKIKFLYDDKQKQAEEQIARNFGFSRINETNENLSKYSEKEKNQILIECNEIFSELAKNMHKGESSEEVRELLIRWHKFIQKFFEPSMEALKGLGIAYSKNPDFRKTFEAIDPELPDFLPKAIDSYVNKLEEKWLESQYNELSH
jgi:hypothetical protein